MDDLMTTEELAAYLKVPKSRSAKARIGLVDGPAFIKLGFLVRYRRQDVVDWVNSHQPQFVTGE